MAMALTSVGYFLYLDRSFTPNAVVVSVIIFNAAFGYSWGPIPWLYPPEIMPLTFRVKGVSISTCTNWAFNWIVGQATPVLQEAIGWRLYTMHACFCICSFIVVYFGYPETCGVPLEEMDRLFGDSSRRDLESSSLVRSRSREAEVTPPDLSKPAAQAKAKPPSMWENVKRLFKNRNEPANNRANYRTIRETSDEDQ